MYLRYKFEVFGGGSQSSQVKWWKTWASFKNLYTYNKQKGFLKNNFVFFLIFLVWKFMSPGQNANVDFKRSVYVLGIFTAKSRRGKFFSEEAIEFFLGTSLWIFLKTFCFSNLDIFKQLLLIRNIVYFSSVSCFFLDIFVQKKNPEKNRKKIKIFLI